MKKCTNDFKTTNDVINISYYDLRKDWNLIESSLAKQYGIRIRHQSDMPWTEFVTLVSGLMHDTPLGQMVSIRSEKDPDVIKQFSPEHRKMHREWTTKLAEEQLKNPEKLKLQMDSLSESLKRAFYKEPAK